MAFDDLKGLPALVLTVLCATVADAQPAHSWVRTNPGGGGAFNLVEGGPTGQIIVGSDLSGAYYSWDGGQSWDVYGAERGMTSTHVSGIGFHPTYQDVFFIGTESGIFKSATGGGDFTHVLTSGYITDIKVAPGNTNTVYATYHPQWNADDGSVYRSVNGGDTWSQVSTNLPLGHFLLKILVHPTNANSVYVLSGSGRFACGPASLFHSTDGGSSWTQIAATLGSVLDVAIHPTNGNILYLTTMNVDCNAPYYWTNLNGSFYATADGGSTWGSVLANRTGCIWIKRDQPTTIRLIDPREPYPWTDGGTFQSTNSGVSWAQTGDVANWETGFQNSLLWAYGSSYNGICKTLGQSLADPDALYWVTNQWVYHTTNGGQTFQHRHTREVSPGWWTSRGADNIVMTDISINETNPSEIYAAFADIGLWRSLDHGASWQSCNRDIYTGGWQGYGGNVTSVITDPARPGTVWTVMQGNFSENAFLLYSNQGGAPNSWIPYNSGLPTTTRISGLSLDRNSPVNNRTIFVCANGHIYKSGNNGQTWTAVLTNGGLWFTAVDHFDGNIVYAGGRNGFYRSLNGGATWSNTGHTEMAGSGSTDIFAWDFQGVSSISPDPNRRGWVYATAYGTGKGAYRSTASGSSWTKLYTNSFMRTIAATNQNPNVIYAGSTSAFYAGGFDPNAQGVLYSSNGGSSWSQVNGTMAWPFAVLLAMDHRAKPNVWVGSPGTGFQHAPIPNVNCTPNLNITNVAAITPGEHRSEGMLVSSNATVAQGNRVAFMSDTGVTLQNEFTVSAGSVFEIKVQGCP